MTALHVALVAGIDPARTRPGGIRSYVIGLGRYLASAGVEVALLGIGGPARNEPFRFVATTRNPNASSLAFHRSLRRTLRDRPVSDGVVHAQRPDDLVPFLADSTDPRLVVTIHGDPLPGIRDRHGRLVSYAYRRLERKGVAAAKRLLFVDAQSRASLAARYPGEARKFVDSSVGIDLTAFHPEDSATARASWDLEDRPHILFTGRFAREKNLPLIVRSLSLCETHPTLLLAGAGSEGAAGLGGLDRMPHRFLGIVPHERMASLYSAVDATVLPSTREAMPLAALESLACGTPVVATRAGRVPDLVESGRNGFVVDGGPSEFARAIDQAIHEAPQMREACRESVVRFGWDRVGPSLIRLYQEVLQ